MARSGLCAAWCALLLNMGGAAVAIDVAAERQRIAIERMEVEAQHRSELAACEARFVVTSCVDTAKARRRAALQVLDGQQAQLDDSRRKQRAADRQAALERRLQADMAQAPDGKVPAPASTKVRPRSAQASSPGSDAASVPRSAASRRAGATSDRETEARLAAATRAQEAVRHRHEVEARNAARAIRKPPAAGLPNPAASRP